MSLLNINLSDTFSVTSCYYLVIVCDVEPGVVGDHVVVDGKDGLGVRLDPRDLTSIIVWNSNWKN